MRGVIVIDKPQGFTSFDVIAVVRRLTGQRKTGHTGTLDPNATGVLPVLLGAATKAQDLIVNHDKEYLAGFRLGMTTDTLDIWGQVKSRCESHISREAVETALGRFRGEIEQIPPMFSAVQQNGQRLYDLARKGIEVARKPRTVTVYRLELLAFDEAEQTKGMPSLIIAHTVKGKGASIMENKASWHHHLPTQEEYLEISRELKERKEALMHE